MPQDEQYFTETEAQDKHRKRVRVKQSDVSFRWVCLTSLNAGPV